MRRIALPLIVAAIAAFGVNQASAAPTCTITAAADGPWTVPATWGGSTPGPADHVCVPAGRTVTLSSGAPVSVLSVQVPGTLRITGSRLNLTATSDDSTARALELTGGTLGGNGTLRISQALTWTGGTMADGGRTVIEAAALADEQNDVTLSDTRTLDVAGTVRLATANGDILRSGSPVIHVLEDGLLEKASTGASAIGPVVDNDGRITATTAGSTLDLDNGGPAGSSSGRFGAPGAVGTVRFDGSVAHGLADGAELLGGVTVNGEVTIPAGATVTASGANAMTAGEVQGTGTLEVGGTLTWTGGAMRDDGITRVLAGATLRQQDSSVALSETRTLVIVGMLELATPDRGINRSGTPVITVTDAGVIRKTSTGSSGIGPIVHNHGRVEATVAGGTLELDNGGGTGASDGDFGATGAAGTVRFDGSVAHRLADGARLLGGVTVNGSVTIPAGATVTASGANAMTAGEVQGDGTFTIDGVFTWSGGAMRHAGVTKVLAGATVTATGTVGLWETRRLENAGTILLATADRHINRSGTPSIHNLAGATIRKTAGGASTIDPALENDGALAAEIAGSTLTVRGGTGGDLSSGSFGGGLGAVRLESFSAGRFVLGPGAAFAGQVTIGSGTVELASGATVPASGALTLAGGTIGGPGNLAVTGSMSWTGGTMGGSGITNVAAGATLALPAGGGFEVTGTRTVVVDGLLDARADNGLYGADSLLHIRPTGTLRKSGGTGWTFVDLPLRNDGAVEGLAGELRLSRGAAQPHTGRFVSASAQAFVALTGDGHVLTGAARIEDFTRIDGDVAVREGDTLELSDDVVQTSGELSGDVKVTGRLTWSGGSHEAPGATTIEVGGEIVVDAASGETCAAASLGEARRVVNRGVMRLINGSYLGAFGEVRPEIHNVGRLELDSGDGGCGAYTGIAGDALVRNTGRIEKLGGAGTSFVGSSLENDGEIVNSTAGELRLESNAAVGHSGSFRGVAFDSGTFVLDPGAAVEGDVAVDGAELRLPEGMTMAVPSGATLRLSGGSIAGAGSVSVSGVLAWSDGDLDGPGTTVIEPGGSARIAPTGDDDRAFVSLGKDGSLVNRGSVTVDDASVSFEGGASMLNRGTLELGDGTRLSGMPYGFGYGALLHNAGTLRTTAGSGVEATLPVDNDGVIEVGTGRLDLPELLNWSGSGFYGESGIAGGAYVVRGTLVVPGTANVNGARLTLDGADSRVVARIGFTGGLTDALAGLRRNAGGAELVLRGGRSLQVAGAFVNQGVLDLGSGSALRANGFRQAAGAVLRPAVTAGGSGRVTSTGPAELGGRLDTPGAAGVAGETTVLTAPSVSGAFAAITGAYQAVVGATDVRLVAPAPVGLLAVPPVEAGELRIDGAALAVRGPWQRRGGYFVARRGGATLIARGVRGDSLALVARTCRRCGAVRVTWAGKRRVVSLRSRRPARRTIRVFGPGRGTVRVHTTSARRVAIDALIVTR